MEGFIEGLDRSIREGNWHAALVMALTVPDICAKAVAPSRRSGERYAEWFDAHLKSKYTSAARFGREPHVFLSGKDCYALRCALLHEGSSDIVTQRARQALDHFVFLTPGRNNNVWHLNQVNQTLVLMVDQFASDVLNAARSWWTSLPEAERASVRARQLTLTDSDTVTGL